MIIAKRIVKYYFASKNIKIRIAVLTIIDNILSFALEEGQEKNSELSFFIIYGKKTKNRPELVFYKMMFYFFANLVNYRRTQEIAFYHKSQAIKGMLVEIGMIQYGQLLEEELKKYK